jgi:diaminopimelate epimerase
MRIFNADGSEAQMCGNGARCAALYLSHQSSVRGRQPKTKKLKLETKAGMINAEVRGNSVKINLTDPVDIRLDLTVKISGKNYEVDFINTGVPHAVVEIKGLDKVPVRELGRLIRHHGLFHPVGTNVDFVNVVDRDHILVRTYERGVEDETLACGTGSVASAIIATLNSRAVIKDRGKDTGHKVFVKTKGGESLVVYFNILKRKITDVWLEGRAEIVFTGRMLLA